MPEAYLKERTCPLSSGSATESEAPTESQRKTPVMVIEYICPMVGKSSYEWRAAAKLVMDELELR